MAGQHVLLDLLQTGTSLRRLSGPHRESEAQAVLEAAQRRFFHQHITEFTAKRRSGVLPVGQRQQAAQLCAVGQAAHHRKLDAHLRTEGVEQRAKKRQHGDLPLLRGLGVADIAEEHRAAVQSAAQPADTVRLHLFIGDGLLGTGGKFAVPCGAAHRAYKLPLLGRVKTGVRTDHQSVVPAHRAAVCVRMFHENPPVPAAGRQSCFVCGKDGGLPCATARG